jgi:hypothetical protein
MAHRGCLAKLNNLDFWYKISNNSIRIGLHRNCLIRIGDIERINFYSEYLNKYTIENTIIGNISTYKTTYDVDLHLPLRGYIVNYNQHEINLNQDTWLIEILEDDYYLETDFFKYEYGV